jgi:hypothetical protein
MEIIAKSFDEPSISLNFFYSLNTHFKYRYQQLKFSNNNKMNQIANHNFGILIFNQEQKIQIRKIK